MRKIIVAGSREGFVEGQVWLALSHELSDSHSDIEIVSGGAKGVDRYGETWAYQANVDVKRFPANWFKHGKAAGFIRNADMARYADELIAFWNGESKGTKHMISVMTDLKKPVTVYYPNDFYNLSEEEHEDD